MDDLWTTLPSFVKLILVGVALSVILNALNSFSERRDRVKCRNALRFLIASLDGYYFYGYPLAKCAEKGISRCLWQSSLGDFSRRMGLLVVVSLHEAMPSSRPRVYWRNLDVGIPERPRHRTYVTFTHGHKRWVWRVDGYSIFDDKGFYLQGSRPNSEYERCSYGDIAHEELNILLACKNPNTSDLAPDYCYKNEDQNAFAQRVRSHISTILALRR